MDINNENNYSNDESKFGGFKNDSYQSKSSDEQGSNPTWNGNTYYSPMSHRTTYEPYKPSDTNDTQPIRKKKHLALKIIAICLAVLLLLGIGSVATYFIVKSQTKSVQELEPEQLIKVEDPSENTGDMPSSPSDSTTNNSNTEGSSSNTTELGSDIADSAIKKEDGTIDATDIYDLYCNCTVGISSSITTTNVFGQTVSGAVSGTGFFVSEDGYIITNYHVIEDAYSQRSSISVMTHDGNSYNASVVGFKEANDIALLKVDGSGFTAVTLGNSDEAKVGETVYALGNPLGELTYTLTSGIVSALDREITVNTGLTLNTIQTDCAINSGNSGGPLINSKGEVIGVVVASGNYSVENIGFVIPINDAKEIVENILTKGYVTGTPYLGIKCSTVSASAAEYYNMVEGVYINSINEGSCAENAGLQAGDIIVSIDNYETNSVDELNTVKAKYNPGDTVKVKIFRDGSYYETNLTFDEEIPVQNSSNSSNNTMPYGMPNGMSRNNTIINSFSQVIQDTEV